MNENRDLFERRKVSSVDVFTQPVSQAEMARFNALCHEPRDSADDDAFVRKRLADLKVQIEQRSQNTRPPMPHWSGVAGPRGSKR